MKAIGLTGGVGMGKTTCAQLLRARGVAVVDTDDLARLIVEPGQPALMEVQAAFGGGIIGSDGRLRRDMLAQVVFGDLAARRKLEGILHPRIRALWQAQLECCRMEGRACAVVVIPLLFETQAESAFDQIICLACSAVTQGERLQSRGWSTMQREQRIAAQMPIEEKMRRAHFVIWTEGDLEVHSRQLGRIMALLA